DYYCQSYDSSMKVQLF
nr:immunoglobulin light chain junction region [Macaca mulatta]